MSNYWLEHPACIKHKLWDGHAREEGGSEGGMGKQGGGLTNVPPSQSALGNDCNTGKMSPKS